MGTCGFMLLQRAEVDLGIISTPLALKPGEWMRLPKESIIQKRTVGQGQKSSGTLAAQEGSLEEMFREMARERSEIKAKEEEDSGTERSTMLHVTERVQ